MSGNVAVIFFLNDCLFYFQKLRKTYSLSCGNVDSMMLVNLLHMNEAS